ncbi:hypothetical protein [Limosilactobacillus pontis]|uniref:hypothetical protein n=1 Tax=Limosilactobacillus pontis TaxID=35787 RepID=UPI0025A35128|nr:hypothetical protein [Limosilactobacillus pontis]
MGKIAENGDWLFHAARVEQIYSNLRHGQFFTFIATDTFHHSGVGSFIFYPTVFFYPWAFLRFFFNPITAFYLWYGGITLLGLLVSYYSMKAFCNNQNLAFLFAVVYIFNPYRLYLGFWPLGEFVAASFLPLVFLGFYRVFFERGKIPGYVTLAIGMSLLLLTHLVSVIITIEIFLVILIVAGFFIGYRKLILQNGRGIVLSVLLTILLTLPFLYLFCSEYLGGKVTSTYFGINMNLIKPLSYTIGESLSNTTNGIGLILVVTLFIGWYFCRNSKRQAFIYGMGIFLLLLSSSIFPWYVFKNTALGVIQMPYRYLEFSCLFLSVIAADILYRFFCHAFYPRQLSRVSLVVVTIAGMLGLYMAAMQGAFTLVRNAPTALQKTVSPGKALPDFTILNPVNYDRQFAYSAPQGETDYYPKATVNSGMQNTIINQTTYVGRKTRPASPAGFPNRVVYQYNLGKRVSIDLPFIAYRKTYLKVNGRTTNYRISNRGTVIIPKTRLHLGTNRVQVGYDPGWLFYVTLLVTGVSWLGSVYFILIRQRRSNIGVKTDDGKNFKF